MPYYGCRALASWPGRLRRGADETFKQTVTAVAVPPNHPLALAFAAKFMAEATTSGILRKAYDDNSLKDHPIRRK